MNLTAEELQDLEEFAAALLTNEQLAEILEIPPPLLEAEMKMPESPVRKAIVKGRLATVTALRKAQIEMALAGSTPAATACGNYINQLKS